MALATLQAYAPQAGINTIVSHMNEQRDSLGMEDLRVAFSKVVHVASREQLSNFEAIVVGRFQLGGTLHLLLASGDVLAISVIEEDTAKL